MNEPKHRCNRREFTKTSLAVGSAVSVGTVQSVFGNGEVGTTDKGRRHRLRQCVKFVPSGALEMPVCPARKRVRHPSGTGTSASEAVQRAASLSAHQ